MKIFYVIFFFVTTFHILVIESNPYDLENLEINEVALVGLPKSVRKYCKNSQTSSGDSKQVCRTLIMTDTHSDHYKNFYERFEIFESSTDGGLEKKVDAITYFKGARAISDKEFTLKKMHKVDTFYPENFAVESYLNKQGLPEISNLYLARSLKNNQLSFALVSLSYSEEEVLMKGDYFVYAIDPETRTISSNPTKTPIESRFIRIYE